MCTVCMCTFIRIYINKHSIHLYSMQIQMVIYREKQTDRLIMIIVMYNVMYFVSVTLCMVCVFILGLSVDTILILITYINTEVFVTAEFVKICLDFVDLSNCNYCFCNT